MNAIGRKRTNMLLGTSFLSIFTAFVIILALSNFAEAQYVTSSPAVLNTNGEFDSKWDSSPQVTTDGAGNWLAVWERITTTDRDIYVARSTDNGSSWTSPALLNSNGTSDSQDDEIPQLTTDGAGNWVAVWHSREDLNGTAGSDDDIFVSRSTNNGMSWSTPALLNTNGSSDASVGFGSDRYPQVATDGSGNWVAVWESNEDLNDTAGSDRDIFVSRSTNNGISWSAPDFLNNNATTDASPGSGQDYFPQVTTDGAGNWVAVWESSEDLNDMAGDAMDIFVATSTNNGLSWSGPASINSIATVTSSHDASPQLATDGAGKWVCVWFNAASGPGADSDILVSTSTDNGATWSDATILNMNGISVDTIREYQPQISTNGSGNWVVVWTSRPPVPSGDFDIYIARSADDATTWNAPTVVHSSLETDSGSDTIPQVTTDGAGHWVVAWTSSGGQFGPGGIDRDILFVTLDATRIWVDFAMAGIEDGSEVEPINSFAEALATVAESGTIKIKGDTADSASSETITVDRAVTIEAVNGSVRIGDGGGRSTIDGPQSGFVTRD